MARYSSFGPKTDQLEENESRGFVFSPAVDERLLSSFSGTSKDFQEGFSCFAPHIERAGLSPGTVAQTYPEDTGRMVSAYLEDPQAVEGAENPLMEAARRGGADTFLEDVFGSGGQYQGSQSILATAPDDSEAGSELAYPPLGSSETNPPADTTTSLD
jgi:hypothetical protein